MSELDISPQGVRTFWTERHDSLLYRIIAALESVQYWVHQGDEAIEGAWEALARSLEKIESIESLDEEAWVAVLAHAPLGRALRVMQFLDQLRPGTASKLLVYSEMHAEDAQNDPGLYLRENLIFERIQLLYRMLSAERLDMVLAALEGGSSAQ